MVNTVNQAAQAQAAAAKKRKDEEAQRSANSSTYGRVNSSFNGLEDEVTPARVSVTVNKQPKRGDYQLKVERNFGTLEDGTEVFVKDITFPDHIHSVDKEKELRRIEDQVRIGHKLNHPNHMSLMGYERISEMEHRLVYNKAPGKDLAEIVSEQGLKTEEVLDITEQVASALEYLHDEFTPAIKHGDLSPGNVRYDSETGQVTIIDHGSAIDEVCDESSHTTRAMTPGFAGQEVGIGRIFTQSDVYGLGALMIYMITKKDPADFYDFTRGQINYEELRPLVEQATTNKDLITLIEDMTNINYKARPSAREVVARVQRLKGLENEIETTYDSGIQGSKVDKKNDNWFIPDWNIPYADTSKVILSSLRNKKKSYERKLKALKKYRKALSYLERDSQMVDLAIKLYSDTSKPVSEIETAVERFDRENPEKIFGYTRKEIALMSLNYFSGPSHITTEQNPNLKRYCSNQNFRKFIELSAEAGLTAKEAQDIFTGIREFNRSSYESIDEEKYQTYLKLLSSNEEKRKEAEREEKQNPYARPQINQDLQSRVNSLEKRLIDQPRKGKYKRDIRELAVLLSLEDEGLEFKHQESSNDNEDTCNINLVFSRSKKRELNNKSNYNAPNEWLTKKLLTFSFSIFPYLTLTNLLGISGIAQGAAVLGGSIATGIALPEAIDYIRRKRTWNEFHGEVRRRYSPEKVLNALVRTMELIPVSERKNLSKRLRTIGVANDKMLSPYEMLDRVLEEYETLSPELSYEARIARITDWNSTQESEPTPEEQRKADAHHSTSGVSTSYNERMRLNKREDHLEQRTSEINEYISNLEDIKILEQKTNVSEDHNITQEIPREKRDKSSSIIGYIGNNNSLNNMILEDFVIRPKRNNYIKNKKYNLNNYLIFNKKDNF
ncbi:protein kinase [archaeon]|jgi:serine/threonine protein kinase|nr:protein kinase [archaeon]MBT3450671.1 protein kinase [archaeon]MBT6868749.1 protein kinase [archaeon]MBT7193030.1 protein kinase [archaeon]MBT7380996.1 protein kinase [archaeon]